MNRKSVGKKLFVAGVLAAGAVGLSAVSTGAILRPRPCICPDVYAPVLCPNGLVYSNSCRAGCAGQTGCVPANIY